MLEKNENFNAIYKDISLLHCISAVRNHVPWPNIYEENDYFVSSTADKYTSCLFGGDKIIIVINIFTYTVRKTV